jgi:DNA ligase-1
MRPKAWDPKKVKFPCWLEPKIDGVRGYNPDGRLLARTMKEHRNKHITTLYSRADLLGFDGELVAQSPTHPDLCRITSSACSDANKYEYTQWWIFDYTGYGFEKEPYHVRYAYAARLIEKLPLDIRDRLRMVPYVVCNNMEELEAAHQKNMEDGYEGSVKYDPNCLHKEGDSSASHGGANRIKDFIDFEAEVLSIEEGQENLNEAQINELGRQFRSSHQANKIGNGMVGNLLCRSLVDVFDLYDTKKLLIAKGQEFTCSPGKMDHPTRKLFFENSEMIVRKIIKAKFFPKGIKDAPRFPTYVCIRSKEDM